ncbi:MAG: hypothetical protein EZS28_019270 [Streblomastix strix]|uniref:Uncharacterized protein n=1 Tax=Streblomastix strix TaxID=222440 RepID=A0A5J4VRL9_9EUKA|nr:MAG: hypothetical protein EZS28_019270 [Streblomastix strix]
MKFVVDCIWRTVTHRNKGDDFILSSDNFIKFWSIVTQEKEDDIEIVLEESIIATHSCLIITGYKQFTQPIQADKFIKTVGTDDQILLANGDTSDIGDFLPKYYPHAMGFVLIGSNADPIDRDGVWKMGSTSSQFRIQKQEDSAYDYKGLIIDFDCISLKFNNQLVAPLPTPPIEYATQQTLAKPKFIGSSYNIPLNAIMYVTKQATTPVVQLNPIPIDCFIDPDGHIKINTQWSDKSPNGDRMAQYPR